MAGVEHLSSLCHHGDGAIPVGGSWLTDQSRGYLFADSITTHLGLRRR